VVAAVDAGMTQVEAGRVFGISRRAVGVWVRAHRELGPAALGPARRGRLPGDPAALSRRQQAQLLQDVEAGCPDAYGLNAELWSRRALTEHIERCYGLTLSAATLGSYLSRWGLVETVRGRARVDQRVLRAWTDPDSGRARRPDPDRWVQVTWSRPAPRFAGTALLPGPGSLTRGPLPGECGPPREHLDLLTAYTARGAAHFRCLGRPYQAIAVRDLGARLTHLCGHPVFAVVHRWPPDQLALLHAWIEDPAPLLDVLVAERCDRAPSKSRSRLERPHTRRD
jgi:transposase